LGITGIDIATGKVPYSDMKTFDAMTMIKEGEPPALEGYFSEDFKSFIACCLTKDPVERPSVEELLLHPFVNHQKRTSILLDLCTLNPSS
jgi:serine/threonine-protein kinase 24/25/MST4